MDFSGMMLYLCVTMFTPGPHNLTMMYLSARRGLRGTIRFFLGSASALLVKLLLCGALNVLLADLLPALMPWLKWLGAGYMLYLAWKMGTSGFRAQDDEQEGAGEGRFVSGVALQCLNMKSWVAALSMFAVYVVPYTTALSAVLLATAVFMGMLVLSTLLWGCGGTLLRRFCREYRKPFGLAMGASLLYCAVTAVL